MSLPNVALGDPHVATHNDERAAINALQTLGVRRSGTFVYFGDSNFQLNTTISTRTYGESVPSISTLLSKGHLLMVENAGVASNSVLDMQARLDADVIALHPSGVVILGGSNSTTKGLVHFASAQAAYVDIVERCLESGIEPIVCTIPPRDGSRLFTSAEPTYGSSAPYIYRLTLAWNVFIRAIAAKYRLRLVDIYATVEDPTTGDYKTGWTADGVHFSQTAAYAVGQLISDALSPLFPNVAAPLARDRYETINFIKDPLFLGALSSGSGTRFPLGFNGSSTAPPAITVEDPVGGDGLSAGKWLRIAKTGASSTNVNAIRTLADWSSGSGLTVQVGDRVAMAFPYKIENAASGGYVSISLNFRGSGGSADIKKTITPMSQYKVNQQGLIYIEDVIPAGTVDLRLDLGAGAAGSIDLCVGQMSIYDLTAMGVPSLLAAL